MYAAKAPLVEYSGPAPAVSHAAPAPVQYAPSVQDVAPVPQPAPTLTFTAVGFIRDVVPDVLWQPQVGQATPLQFGIPVQYGGRVSHAPALQNATTVAGVVMNCDGAPDALLGFATPVQCGAPVNKVGATQSVLTQCGAPPAVPHGTTPVIFEGLTDDVETGHGTANG